MGYRNSREKVMSQSSINNSCRDCVFATYKDNKQDGCRLGRIELFVRQGTCVEEFYDVDPAWDEEAVVADWKISCDKAIAANEEVPANPIPPQDPSGLRFYHLRGRICMANRHRESPWTKQTQPDQWASKVKEEMQLRLVVLVPISDNDTVDEIVATAESLERQNLPPRAIHFLLNTSKIKSSDLISKLRKLGPALVWNVRTIVERTKKGERVSTGRCIDVVVNPLKPHEANYYAVFYPGFKVPNTFISELNSALNERLERFIMLRLATPYIWEPAQGLVVQTKAHQMVSGNREAEHDTEYGKTIKVTSVEEKLALMVVTDNCEYLIKEVVDVCPSLA